MTFLVYLTLVGIGSYLTIRFLAPEWNKPVPPKPKIRKSLEPKRTTTGKFFSLAQSHPKLSLEVQSIKDYIERMEKERAETVKSFEEVFTHIDVPQLQNSFNTYRKTKESIITELSEKCRKFEQLLGERGKELKRADIDRDNELRHREEFQKVRELLETQLQELKEKNKALQLENAELKKQNEALKDQFSTKAIF